MSEVERVENRMFRHGATARMCIQDAADVRSGSLWVTIGAGELEPSVDRAVVGEVRLVFKDWELQPEQVSDLCEMLLAGHGVIPRGTPVVDTCVDVPLIEPESPSKTTVTWRITDALVLVHEGRQNAYFHVQPDGTESQEDVFAPREALDGPASVRLTEPQAWRAVQALASLAVWQLDLDADFTALASERRQMLGREQAPPPAIFAGATAREVKLPVEYVPRARITVHGERTTLAGLADRDDDALVELVSDWGPTDRGLERLEQKLVSVRGLVPPQWMRPGGRAAVPFVEGVASALRVEWRVNDDLLLVHLKDGSVCLGESGFHEAGAPLTVRLSLADARLLLRALVSIRAWRQELESCAAAAMTARRLERAAELAVADSPHRPFQA